jgi:hypothetical protein
MEGASAAISFGFSAQAGSKAAQHTFDLYGRRSESPVRGFFHEPQIPGEKQMILKFAGGTQRYPDEPAEFPVARWELRAES